MKPVVGTSHEVHQHKVIVKWSKKAENSSGRNYNA